MFLKCNKGFTLLESLLVLMIVSIMSLVLIVNIQPVHDKKVTQTFFEQFEKDLLYAQQYAMTYQKRVFIAFDHEKHLYRIQLNTTGDDLVIRDLNKDFQFTFGTLPKRFSYTSNGAIDRSGTMLVKYKDKSYRVVFYLGRGRFYVEEL